MRLNLLTGYTVLGSISVYARRALLDEWLAAVGLRLSRLSEFSSASLHLQGFSARLGVGADTDGERQPHDDGGSAVTDEWVHLSMLTRDPHPSAARRTPLRCNMPNG